MKIGRKNTDEQKWEFRNVYKLQQKVENRNKN